MSTIRWSVLLLTLPFLAGPTLGHVLPGHGGALCGGTAPTTTDCSTGDHLTTWATFVELDFRRVESYTGVLEARLDQDPGNTFVLRCEYASGSLLGCIESGEMPLPGVPFTHKCHSYDAGTPTPGGSGAWRCRIHHYVV